MKNYTCRFKRYLYVLIRIFNPVQDLLNAQSDLEDVQGLVNNLTSPIYKNDPDIGLKCAIDILLNLLSLHEELVEKRGSYYSLVKNQLELGN